MEIDLTKLPPPPHGLMYHVQQRATDTAHELMYYVFVRTIRQNGGYGPAIWCLDAYWNGNERRFYWRVEHHSTKWNRAHEGLEGFDSVYDACTAMCNYAAVMGSDYQLEKD